MKDKVIKLLKELEQSKKDIDSKSISEQLFLLNKVESKIEILKYLLEDA